MTQPPRRPTDRSRVLVIGGDDELGSLVDALANDVGKLQVRRMDGYLHAMGELGAKATPGAIVADASALPGDEIDSTIAALRELAPASRLVMVFGAGTADQHRRFLEAGCDRCIVRPLDPSAIAAALGWSLERPSAGPPQTGDPDAEPGQPDSSPGDALTDAGVLVPGASIPFVAVPDDELGDVDLVEQLVRDRRGFLELALRLVRDRLRNPALERTARLGDIPAGHVVAQMRFDEHELGYLHAPSPTTQAEIESWGRWLSRWLMLDRQLAGLRDMAMRDELTGAWNRRYFDRFFKRILDRAADERFGVTLMVFDIDDFKLYNDRYGHAEGDEILRETVRLMRSVVRDHDVVARIGGDEFAVIFWDAEGPRAPNSEHPNDVRVATRRFREAIAKHRFPKLRDEAHGRLTVSGGLAGYPWDGRTAGELLEHADAIARRSKQQGKDAIAFGPGAETTG